MLRSLQRLEWLILIGSVSLPLAAVGTFRDFGFDLSGVDGVRTLYPSVADGWGAWYWFAQLGLDFNVYFFVLSLLLACGILMLAFPCQGRHYSKSVSITITIYLVSWFLFAHTRFGTAVVLVAMAIGANSVVLLLLAGIVAFLFHRAIAGAMVLIALWLMLRHRKHGLIIAVAISAGLAAVLNLQAGNILLLTAYDNYTAWDNLPATNTALKYYYDILLLGVWKLCGIKTPNSLLILALLFLPTSYYNVFAGRAHEVYAAVFLAAMLSSSMPRVLRYLLLAEYMADVSSLLFSSGAFF